MPTENDARQPSHLPVPGRVPVSRGPATPARVVHLELHTPDVESASAFYRELLGWETEQIVNRWGSYRAVALGDDLDGGMVQCANRCGGWLPYVEVERIESLTDRARGLGASVLLGPREGPAGWRSVVSSPAGGQIALWQHKPRLSRWMR